MPKLSGASEIDGFASQQVSITAIGTPLDVDFPRLGDVNSLSLSGAIQKL